MLLAALAAGLFVAVAINVLALVSSRRGISTVHSRAFVSGLVGLCGLPVLLVGFVGLLSQLLFAKLLSLPGALLVAGGLATLGGTAVSVVQLIKLRPRPNSSSKPTPLRGAA